MTRLKKKAYAAAGVDIALGNLVKRGLQEKVKTTFGPEVLGRIGAFGKAGRGRNHRLGDAGLVHIFERIAQIPIEPAGISADAISRRRIDQEGRIEMMVEIDGTARRRGRP